MLAEVGEGVARVAQPLRRRVEGVAGVAVAVADVGLAHQAPVEGLHIAAAPGRAGVEADLAEAVEDLAAAPAQQHRIVAIEPAAFHPLAGQRQQRRVGHAVGEDEGLARRQAAAQVDAAARRAGAVEIELDAVGGEVEDLAAAVVELQRLVVAAAFDILGDDQLGGVGHRQAQQGQAAQQGGVTQGCIGILLYRNGVAAAQAPSGCSSWENTGSPSRSRRVTVSARLCASISTSPKNW